MFNIVFSFITSSINEGIFEKKNNKYIYKFVEGFKFRDNFFFLINSLIIKDEGVISFRSD